MKSIASTMRSFLRDEQGPTATEYAIMLALIIVVSIVSIAALGTKVSSVFSAVDGTLATPGAS